MQTLQKTQATQQAMPGMWWDIDSSKPTQLHDLCQNGGIEAEMNRLEVLNAPKGT